MSVNGIEVAVGQKWRRRNDEVVTIRSIDCDAEEGCRIRIAEYPTTYDKNGHTSVEGARVRGCDLVDLVEPAPATGITSELKAAVTAHKPSAHEILEAAACHMAARAATYDKPEGERSMGKTVEAFNAITGHNLSEAEGWLLLQILKDVRLFQRPGFHQDSAEDCVAYAALKAEAKSSEAV